MKLLVWRNDKIPEALDPNTYKKKHSFAFRAFESLIGQPASAIVNTAIIELGLEL